MKYSFSKLQVDTANGAPVVRFTVADEEHNDATLEVAKQLAPLDLLRPFVDRVVKEEDLFVQGMDYRLSPQSEIVMTTTPVEKGSPEIVLFFDPVSDRTPDGAAAKAMRGVADIMHERGLVDDDGRAQFLAAVDQAFKTSDAPPRTHVR